MQIYFTFFQNYFLHVIHVLSIKCLRVVQSLSNVCASKQGRGGSLAPLGLFSILFVSLKTQGAGGGGAQPEDDRQPVTGNRRDGGEEERTQYRKQEQGAGAGGKKAKNPQEPDHFRPPPLQNKVVFGSGPSAQNRYITPTLRVSEFFLSLRKRIAMMYNDLTVKNGRLINTRPNDVTGIQQAIQIKKDVKKAKKLEMYSDAMALGIEKAETMKAIKKMF